MNKTKEKPSLCTSVNIKDFSGKDFVRNRPSKTCKSKQKSNNNCTINLVHQNIQGMLSKELEIELFMNSDNIDVLCVTEHWLKAHQFMFGFKNHQIASSFSREQAIHGGSLILIHKSIKYKERADVVSLSVERTTEIACIELERLIIMSVYRPPASSFEVFEKIMDEALIKVGNCNKNIVVCGDFNIDLLDSSCKYTNWLISLFNCHNLL